MNKQLVELLIERWLVACILIIVATIQITLAYSAGLSPWKGGGFGMFGAVDSPSMRAISAVGIDSSGTSHRINAWSALSTSERRSLQSFPQSEVLQNLAKKLLSSDFVRAHSEAVAVYNQLKSENPLIDLQITPTTPIDVPIFRVRKPEDQKLQNDQVKSFQKIHLQMWRIRFDSHRMTLSVEPFVGPILLER